MFHHTVHVYSMPQILETTLSTQVLKLQYLITLLYTSECHAIANYFLFLSEIFCYA